MFAFNFNLRPYILKDIAEARGVMETKHSTALISFSSYRGVDENTHSTDVESTNRVRASA